jgi:Capsule assembly protein Wzi
MKQTFVGVRVLRRLSFSVVAVVMVFGANVGAARADAGWFESGDTVLRNDLQLLNDAGVIRLPVTQWPIPRAAVKYALQNAKEHFAVNKAVMTALERVRGRVVDATDRLKLEASAAGGEAGLLRDFDTLSRENGDVTASAIYSSGRFAASLRVGGAINAADDQSVRLDGSHATVQLGNWLLSANALDRFWGPSHESSLILSNNARPMPTLMVERAEARAPESKWLSWIGPWRMSFGVSQMENHREDIDAPLFMAWRITIMPLKDLEIGFSRTAQFCGKQLECNWSVFGNLLVGNDNVGIDATPENEPGNQMAGFDLRWNSPIGNWPYAIYSQMIGEDESSYVPAKYLAQYGAEVWKPLADGGLVQGFAEYSSTTCSANTSRGPYYNCAYTQGRFDVEGYRYRGRVIGHTTDADSETYSVGATYTAPAGDLWTATLRTSQLNHDGIDVRDTVSAGPAKYSAVELGWKGKRLGEHVSVDLGVEQYERKDGSNSGNAEPFGFVGWRHEFNQ